MPEICKSCTSRTYCYMLNFRVFQYFGFVLNFDECPLYTRADECVQGKDQPEPEDTCINGKDVSGMEEEFEINVEITVHCKMKEFQLDDIKPKSHSQLKRLSILIDREGLQRELRMIIDREIKRKLGKQGRDSVMREHAKTNIEVPLIFSNWILN